MTITQTQINAVLDWIYNERAIDIQSLSNQDNPNLIGRKYVIVGMTLGNTTTIEVDASVIDNFKENQIIKFVNIEDETLETELSDLVPEELRIASITGSFITINLDSSAFGGVFTGGKIINTYNIRVLNYGIKKGILNFEKVTGISFDYTSEHHLDYVSTSTLMALFSRASAAYKELQEEMKEISKSFTLAKAEFLSGDDVAINENKYDMDNRSFRGDFGIGYPNSQNFED